jgi:hypothetical protein
MEAKGQVGVGFGVAVLAQIAVFPLFGLHATIAAKEIGNSGYGKVAQGVAGLKAIADDIHPRPGLQFELLPRQRGRGRLGGSLGRELWLRGELRAAR